MSLAVLRQEFHRQICKQILRVTEKVPNIADKGSKASRAIANSTIQQLPYPVGTDPISGQKAGRLFEEATCDFLEKAFALLRHLRPGKWLFSVGRCITDFEQYEHLADIQRILDQNPELKAALGGDYLVAPDIVIGRYPVPDEELNVKEKVVGSEEVIARLSPLRERNRPSPKAILHASVSCKWTIRSDRAQNIRTEGLNLIRNRKGHTPHIIAVTAEPLPTRLASLALGTGDLDCVYHFALPELQTAVEAYDGDQLEVLTAMIEGRRLRDISDLPLDLAI